MPRNKTITHSPLNNFLNMALGAIGSIGNRAERSFKKNKSKFQRWLVEVVVLGLSIFMSLAFLVIGLFFMVIDFGGVPRGVVFVCGGLLGLLVLRLMIPSSE